MREKVIRFMQENKISTRALARGIQYSHAAVVNYLKNKYDADTKHLETAISEFIAKYEEKRSEQGDGEFIPIAAAMDLWETLEFAREEREIVVVIGNSGCGKTFAKRAWLKKNGHGCVSVECHVRMTGRGLILELLEAMGSQENEPTTRRAVAKLVKELQKQPRMLIIDEADVLPIDGYELLRHIWDMTSSPIVLIGMPALLEKMTTSKEHRHLIRLYNRVGMGTVLPDLSFEEAQAILKRYGFNLDRETVQTVLDKTWRCMRRFIKLCKHMQRLRKKQIEIDAKVVKQIVSEFLVA